MNIFYLEDIIHPILSPHTLRIKTSDLCSGYEIGHPHRHFWPSSIWFWFVFEVSLSRACSHRLQSLLCSTVLHFCLIHPFRTFWACCPCYLKFLEYLCYMSPRGSACIGEDRKEWCSFSWRLVFESKNIRMLCISLINKYCWNPNVDIIFLPKRLVWRN